MQYSEHLLVQGQYLDSAVSIDEVKVYVGLDRNLTCNITIWQSKTMSCKLPQRQKLLSKYINGGGHQQQQQQQQQQQTYQNKALDGTGQSGSSNLPEVIVVVGSN